MMTFAQPWALLSLLSLPILIYLYRLRPKREDAVVSSVMFWHEAVKIRDSRRNFHRILRDLNLWLLLALALLLGIAVANPQWQVTARQSQDSVLIIDISASMGARSNALGRTRFDEAKAKAGQIIDALPDGGRLLVMTSARYARAQSGFEADRDRLHAIVARLEVTQQSGRPQAAFALARTLLRSREQAQLHFITDGAFDTDLGLVTSASERHLVGDQRANVAITRFDIRPALHSDDEYEVFLAIRNFGQQSIEAPVRISMDASVLVERNITVEGQREVSLALPMSGRLGTRAQARIAVDDALDVDNAAFMAFASP
ncbi:MAG: VWA domain-containing protein, partial [Gammaproteobacteria bacterium]|nr:VWA domain-containing protein [Gammaproteobacteria bacterium]